MPSLPDVNHSHRANIAKLILKLEYQPINKLMIKMLKNSQLFPSISPENYKYSFNRKLSVAICIN